MAPELKLRVLIIEDCADDAFLMLRELRRGGYDPAAERVDSAEGLAAALTAHSWDVIIADYNLPHFNALEALEQVKTSGQDIPFIVVSGKIGEDLAVSAMKAGAHDYLMKGNLQRLVPAIERELREAGERRLRRQAEESLRSQFLQISTIFDSLNALVYVADLGSYELLYMNRFGATAFGQEWPGKKCYELIQGGQSEPCSFCTNDRLVKDGVPLPPCKWEYENPVTGKWYQCIDRAIRWTDGRLVRMEIAVDITDRKEMEQLKEEMLSAVSHEMRTPLTAMLGFTEYLLECDVDQSQLKALLGTMHKETERLHELISNFLDLQKMKARQDIYRFAPVEVHTLLQDAVALFRADQGKHSITIECPALLPPVRGDGNKLHQVLTNLIANACKYSPIGTRISVGARREGHEVVLWVRDEGIGIPEELQERIFEKFYRIDNTDRRATGGTGLGLAVVKEIVAAHDGRVWVERNRTQGSIFFVAVPVMEETAGQVTDLPGPHGLLRSPVSDRPILPHHRPAES